jgi:hypothetical protein
VTICEPIQSSDSLECNGFGVFRQSTGTCDCDHSYAGSYCERCEDERYEYPDCTGSVSSDTMKSADLRSTLQRRKNNVYHADYL